MIALALAAAQVDDSLDRGGLQIHSGVAPHMQHGPPTPARGAHRDMLELAHDHETHDQRRVRMEPRKDVFLHLLGIPASIIQALHSPSDKVRFPLLHHLEFDPRVYSWRSIQANA